jgi:hypothetical protein
MRSAIPPVVLGYGLLGLIPFLAPPLAGFALPEFRDISALVLALYGALILSFLGGARFGFANTQPEPPIGVISLSMLPTLVSLALLVIPASQRRLQLLGLAAALVVHWFWDMQSDRLPSWYGRLRTLLTAGAAAGLTAGAFTLV